MLRVVPGERLAIERAQVGGDDTETLALEAADDLTDQTPLDRVGFTDDESAIHGGRG